MAAPQLGLRLIDQAHVQVCVDAHLLARHAVEREAGRHLGHPLRAVGHHHVLHHHQDQEDDQPDHIIALHHVRADRGDHPAGIGIAQDQPGRGDVQRQPEQGCDQQQRRKGGEIDRLARIEGDQQDQQREAEVDDQEHIEQRGGDRCEQDHQDPDHHHHQDQVVVLAQGLAQAHAACSRLADRSRIA